jgi:hypothetical protein
MVIVQQSAEARPTGDLVICPVVIRRTDVSDELAINPYDPAVRARVPNRGEDGIRRLQFSTSIRPCT